MSKHFKDQKEVGDFLCGLIFIGGNIALILTAISMLMQDVRSFVLFGVLWLGSMILFWFVHSWVYADERSTFLSFSIESDNSAKAVLGKLRVDQTTPWHMSERPACPTCNGNGRCMACGGCGVAGGYLVARHPNINPKPKCYSCYGTGICGKCKGMG